MVDNRKEALKQALAMIEKQFGQGSIMTLGEKAGVKVETVPSGSIALDEAGGKIVAPKFDGKDVKTSGPNQWPMKATSYLASGKTPSEATKRFLQFVKSPDGARIIKQEKAFPVP